MLHSLINAPRTASLLTRCCATTSRSFFRQPTKQISKDVAVVVAATTTIRQNQHQQRRFSLFASPIITHTINIKNNNNNNHNTMQGNHPPRIDLVVGIHEIKCHHHQRSQRRFMAYVPKHIKAHSPHNKLAEPPTKENKLLSRGEVFGMTPEWSFIPTITICLILATNLIVFIMWQSASTPESKMFMVNNFTTSLANTMERPWTVVTHIFSHATLSHFLWNMFNLYATAFIVQRALGWTGFMVVYFGGGIIPSLLIDGVRYLELRDVLQQLEQHSKVKTPSMRRSLLEQEKELQLKAATLLHGRSLGASGSICALLGSLLVMFPHSRIPLLTMIPYIQDHVFLFCSFMVIMDLFLINANDNVGHVAHLSGFGLGLLITAAYFARRRRLPPTRAYF